MPVCKVCQLGWMGKLKLRYNEVQQGLNEIEELGKGTAAASKKKKDPVNNK